ncbi:MAG: hypothetical protein AB1894_19910 [Chloroflexota bacterium]
MTQDQTDSATAAQDEDISKRIRPRSWHWMATLALFALIAGLLSISRNNGAFRPEASRQVTPTLPAAPTSTDRPLSPTVPPISTSTNTPAATATQTTLPSYTPTYPPSQTPAPSPTLALPVQAGTPLPFAQEPITIENLERLQMLGIIDVGLWVEEMLWLPGGERLAILWQTEQARGQTAAGVNIYTVPDLSLQSTFTADEYGLMQNTLAFSPDGQTFATGDNDVSVRLWQAANGHPSHRLRGHNNLVYGLSFSPDGQYLASGSEDHTVKIWQSPDWNLLRTIPVHPDAVTDVEFSPDGQYLATASRDHTIRLWSTSDWRLLSTYLADEAQLGAVFSPDSQLLAATTPSKVNVLATSGGELNFQWYQYITYQEHDCASFSADSRLLASGNLNGKLFLTESSTGWVVKELDLIGSVNHLAFSPEGRYLAVHRTEYRGTPNWEIQIWGIVP